MPMIVSTSRLPRSAPRSRMVRVRRSSFLWKTTKRPTHAGSSTMASRNSFQSSQSMIATPPASMSRLLRTESMVSAVTRWMSLTSLLMRDMRSPSRKRL